MKKEKIKGKKKPTTTTKNKQSQNPKQQPKQPNKVEITRRNPFPAWVETGIAVDVNSGQQKSGSGHLILLLKWNNLVQSPKYRPCRTTTTTLRGRSYLEPSTASSLSLPWEKEFWSSQSLGMRFNIPRVTARDGDGTQWVRKVHPRITSLIRALPQNQPHFPAAGIYLSFHTFVLWGGGGVGRALKGEKNDSCVPLKTKNPPTNTSAAAEEFKNSKPAWKKGKVWPQECPARTELHILLLFLCFPPLELPPLCFYSATLLFISSF